MAMDGLLVCACALFAGAPPAPVSPRTDAERRIADRLVVQTALQNARDFLRRRDPKSAVRILEGQLSRINGNREYLQVLRDAYREYLKELALKNDTKEFKKKLYLLTILDKDAARSLSHLVNGKAQTAPRTAAPKSSSRPLAPKSPVFRAKGEDDRGKDDPFRPALEAKPVVKRGEGKLPTPSRGGEKKPSKERSRGAATEAGKLLEQADREFRRKRYSRALGLYEAAGKKDAEAAKTKQNQWAYCKLHQVVEQLNRSDQGPGALKDMEREVRLALAMAPRLEKTGRWLLQEIRDRRKGGTKAQREEVAATFSFRHLRSDARGWSVAETTNFRIYHKQSRATAEKVAQIAEKTRRDMARKWFGKVGEDWNPKCELYLHADGKEYQHFTGVSPSSPGHSRIETDAGRVVGRRIDLRCDNKNLLRAVLPHETTHVVLAGRFGKFLVPRWADEGMAVLTEPDDKVSLHRKNLERCRKSGQLFSFRSLMQMDEYPQARLVGAFYAQSVSLVEYLSRRKGAVVFSQFLRDALRDGYAPALRKHYNFQSFDELQTAWSRDTFGEKRQAAKPRALGQTRNQASRYRYRPLPPR
jgi:hypothetical protein